MNEDRSRHIRALLRNAILWAAAWGIAGGAIVTALSLFRPDPAAGSLIGRLGLSLLSGIGWGVRFAIAGAVIGTVFSTVIRLGYRGRRLRDINPVGFTLLGAVIGGAGVPLFLQMMNVLTGGGAIAWGLVLDDAGWATVFGGAAAAGSLLLARRAEALPGGASPDPLERIEQADAPPAAGLQETIKADRSPPART